MSPVWKGYWRGVFMILDPSNAPPAPSLPPCPWSGQESSISGAGEGMGEGWEGSTRGKLCGPEAGRLWKADLLWPGCRKPTLISSCRVCFPSSLVRRGSRVEG